MEHLTNYVLGLNAAIAAGVNVMCVPIGEKRPFPVIRTIEIWQDLKALRIWYLKEGADVRGYARISALFSVQFDDLPNDLRAEGWNQ